MTEQKHIETVLATIERPSSVIDIRHALDTDWTGDPAVFIWVILRDDVAGSSGIAEHTKPIRSTIVQALRDAEIGRWPFLRFRGQAEQEELDRAEAA